MSALIVAVDLGNTRAKFGCFDGKKKIASLAVGTDSFRSRGEWNSILSAFCSENGVSPSSVEGTVFSGVDPFAGRALREGMTDCFGKTPLTVGHGIRTGLDLRIDYQSELGADIVANAAGAAGRTKAPFLVADLGTALTVFAVDGNSVFRGVNILPGVASSAKALSRDCAALPEVFPEKAGGLFGKNTLDSISGGILLGFASLLDGMAARTRAEFGTEELPLFATGGDATLVCAYCEEPFADVPDLTLEGLMRLWELNRPRQK